MGSIGIISLTTRRNRRFFISAEHIQLLRCGTTEVMPPAGSDAWRRSASSDPLVGDLPDVVRKSTDQGLDEGPRGRAWGAWGLGWSRDLLFRGAGLQVVETRRLELLTLSLQRRRSAN